MLLLELALVLAVALLCGELARRARLPAVLGELVGGVLIGPTVLGALAPGLQGTLFPAAGATRTAFDAIVELGMFLFLFTAGLEIELEQLRRRRAAVLWTSVFGMAVPLACGAALVALGAGGLRTGPGATQPVLVALCIGTILAISALPVIARILLDLGLTRHPLGQVVIGAATLDDVAGWAMFAVIVRRLHTGGGGPREFLATLALVASFFAVVVVAGRWAGHALLLRIRASLPWPSGFLGVSVVLVLLAAHVADRLGVHAGFGAFAAGVALARHGPAHADHDAEGAALAAVRQFVSGFFVPIYFVAVGLGMDFRRDFDAGLAVLVFAVATVSKIAGAWLGARLGRLAPREALAVAFGMNARGAMAVILSGVARREGLVDERVFLALIVTAVATSVVAAPAMSLLTRDGPPADHAPM